MRTVDFDEAFACEEKSNVCVEICSHTVRRCVFTMCSFPLGDPLRMLFNHKPAGSVIIQLAVLCHANNTAQTTTN